MLRIALVAVLLGVPFAARADEFNGEKDSLSTQEKAEIKSERDEAEKNINDKYKDDGTSESRHARQQELQQADEELAKKHGVSPKTLRQQEAHTSPDERQEIDDQAKTITSERQKKKAGGGVAGAAPGGEVEVVKGFSEDKPVDLVGGSPGAKAEAPKLDENGQPMPTVEKNIKAEDGTDAAPSDSAAKDDPYARFEKGGGSHHKRRKKANYDE